MCDTHTVSISLYHLVFPSSPYSLPADEMSDILANPVVPLPLLCFLLLNGNFPVESRLEVAVKKSGTDRVGAYCGMDVVVVERKKRLNFANLNEHQQNMSYPPKNGKKEEMSYLENPFKRLKYPIHFRLDLLHFVFPIETSYLLLPFLLA